MSFREWLHRVDPYEDFPDDLRHVDKQGWGFDDHIFGLAIHSLRPRLIVEVGSWKGMSALRMAAIVKAAGLDCEIVCIDTWIGSVEHLQAWDEDWFRSLRMRNGFPSIYYTFLSNVLDEGHSDIVTPFPATSENAAVILQQLGTKADIIYIDAAHEYEPVLRDMRKLWPVLADGGLLIMDDYATWPGVTEAIHQFVSDENLQPSSLGWYGKAVLAKSPTASVEAIRTFYAARNELLTPEQAVANMPKETSVLRGWIEDENAKKRAAQAGPRPE